MNDLMNRAVELGLFDFQWYQTQHKTNFPDALSAFNDYIRKSPFTDISPSKNFDGILYYENNPGVYEEGLSPLEHYIRFGKDSGLPIYQLRPLWLHKQTISPLAEEVNFVKPRIAIVLHIFYSDFVERFASALTGVDYDFDLFVTAIDASIQDSLKANFKHNHKLKNTYFKVVPNRGRNFSFLVEFGKVLLNYDLFCHLHSKKSLYSGKEQVQWSEYLLEYLLRDKHVIAQVLNLFETNKNFGLFYPTSFWNLPPWVNHWLKNKGIGRKFLIDNFDINDKEEFFPYPVGGMFWAKSAALKDILNFDWRYENLPSEPVSTDGTILHVIERILPKVANKNGFDQFFYYPPTGEFTEDTSYIYRSYYYAGLTRLLSTIQNIKIVSFDVFDTIIKRDYYEPDFAKFLLPQRCGLDIDGKDFVLLRNEAELKIRKRHNFSGDVNIYEIYDELLPSLHTNHSSKVLADLEFAIDIEMMSPKYEIVDIINRIGGFKVIWFVTDIYYSLDQIKSVIAKAGVSCQYKLLVSSETRLRKDNGSVWKMISGELDEFKQKIDFIHIGDNVCSDSQIPGDEGIKTFHILSPQDKWLALGFEDVAVRGISVNDISSLKKYGPLISHIGSSPFI
jgi:hypothetical protein